MQSGPKIPKSDKESIQAVQGQICPLYTHIQLQLYTAVRVNTESQSPECIMYCKALMLYGCVLLRHFWQGARAAGPYAVCLSPVGPKMALNGVMLLPE